MSRLDRGRKRGRLIVLAGSAVAALGFFAVVAAAPPPGSAPATNPSTEVQQVGNPSDGGGFDQSGYSQPQFIQQPRFRSRGS